jgi:branched-chain amino acid transport system substrate-binding protein
MSREQGPIDENRRRLLKGMAMAGAAFGLGGIGFLAGCSSPKETGGSSSSAGGAAAGGAAAAPTTIQVALVTALTGPNAAWGVSTKKGFEVAIDMMNSAGGVASKGGAKLVLKTYDTESKPEVAGTQTERAIGDGALIVTGCNQSPASLVASQICERRQIPFITGSDTDGKITGRGLKYTFRTSPLIDTYAADLVKFYVEQGKMKGKPPKTIAILCENSIVGKGAQDAYAKAAKEMGLEIVDSQSYDAAASSLDFTGFISKYKAANIDLLVGHNKPADAIRIVRTCKEQKYNPMAIGGAVGGHVVVDFVDSLGTDSNHISGSDGFSVRMKSDLLPKLNATFQAKFNADIDSNSAQGFSVTGVLWDVLERATSLKGPDVRDAMAKTSLKHGEKNYIHTGGCKFGDQGDNANAQAIIWQIDDKKWYPVGPAAVAAKDFVFPKPAW